MSGENEGESDAEDEIESGDRAEQEGGCVESSVGSETLVPSGENGRGVMSGESEGGGYGYGEGEGNREDECESMK